MNALLSSLLNLILILLLRKSQQDSYRPSPCCFGMGVMSHPGCNLRTIEPSVDCSSQPSYALLLFVALETRFAFKRSTSVACWSCFTRPNSVKNMHTLFRPGSYLRVGKSWSSLIQECGTRVMKPKRCCSSVWLSSAHKTPQPTGRTCRE